MRKLFAVMSVVLVADIALQFYLAAVGVFSMPEDELFSLHGTNGRMVLPLVIVLWIVSGFLARAGGRTIRLQFLVLGLLALQTILFILAGVLFGATPPPEPSITTPATVLLGFHAVNGLAILATTLVVTRRALALSRSSSVQARSEVPARVG